MRLLLSAILLLINIPSNSQPYISKTAALADIDFYNKTLEQVHYNPYLYISKETYQKKTDSIKNTITDSIEIKSFLLKLFSLTAPLQDGHAIPQIPTSLRAELLKKQFLPIVLVIDEQQNLFAKGGSKDSTILVGSQILSINGIDMKDFIAKAMNYSGGLPHYKKEMSAIFLSYYLFLNNVSSPFHITYLNSNNQQQKAAITEGLDFRSSLSLSVPNSGRPPYSFNVINSKVGYIDFVAMSGSYQTFGNFLDSSFRVMRNNGINTLAVDIRKNSGGNSILADLLLSYITKKDFSLMGKRFWKISEQYKDYLKTRGDTSNNYLKQKSGSLWEIGKCGAHKQKFKVDTVFTGKVFILTGPFTYSSANMLADGAKQYKLATVIGEPTGESTNDFGEVYVIELPNSKIKVQATTSFDIGADCKKDYHLPVLPDVLIKTTTAEKINNIDPVMDYIIKQTAAN